MKSNRIKSKMIEDSKTQFRGELGRGVIWALKEFSDLNIKEISELIGWKKQSVKDEIRRIRNSIIFYLIEEKKNKKGYNTYNLHKLAKTASLDLLDMLAKTTHLFNSSIIERIKK